MIIGQANIQLGASHHYRERTETHEKTTLLLAPTEATASQDETDTPVLPEARISASKPQAHSLTVPLATSANDRLQMLIISQLFRQITGQDFCWCHTE